MNCQEMREKMSEYLDKALAEPENRIVAEHLSKCCQCRQEMADLKSTLDMLHGLPRQEPVFDLWADFSPRICEIQSEMETSIWRRFQRHVGLVWAGVVEGWAIFFTAVRHNAMGGDVT